jgi:predicted RNA-binding Zn-ribbon protein involved in translation (DUF1610 family)
MSLTFLVYLTILTALVVGLGSGSSGFYCPICGSELVTVKYVGDERAGKLNNSFVASADVTG